MTSNDLEDLKKILYAYDARRMEGALNAILDLQIEADRREAGLPAVINPDQIKFISDEEPLEEED